MLTQSIANSKLVIICCSLCSLLCSCTAGTKIPLGSNGSYYERISEEELIENHRNPRRMAEKLEAERQIETNETIERLKNIDKVSRDNELNDLIDRNIGRP